MILYALTIQRDGRQHIEYASTSYVDTLNELERLEKENEKISMYEMSIDIDDIPRHRRIECIMNIMKACDIRPRR